MMLTKSTLSNRRTSAILTTAAVAAVGLALSAGNVQAQSYVQVTPVSTLQPAGGGVLSSASLDGTNAYSLFTNPNVTGVTGLNSTPTNIWTTSSTTYNGVSGGTGASGILWNANSTTLILADNASHSIIKVDKATGNPTAYFTTAQIKSVTGDTGNPSLSESAVTANGDLYVWDASSITASKGIYQTSGGNFSEVLSGPTITSSIVGNNAVAAFTVDGPLIIFGDSTNHSIYSYNTSNGAFTTLLTQAQIAAVNGTSSEAFTATGMFYGPDGNVYYDEANSTTNKDIMEFNPLNPTGTLTTVLTGAQLLAGPADSTIVSDFTWNNGEIAWTNASTATGAVEGIYSVPEPGSLSLLAAAGCMLTLRRRRKPTAPAAKLLATPA